MNRVAQSEGMPRDADSSIGPVSPLAPMICGLGPESTGTNDLWPAGGKWGGIRCGHQASPFNSGSRKEQVFLEGIFFDLT